MGQEHHLVATSESLSSAAISYLSLLPQRNVSDTISTSLYAPECLIDGQRPSNKVNQKPPKGQKYLFQLNMFIIYKRFKSLCGAEGGHETLTFSMRTLKREEEDE